MPLFFRRSISSALNGPRTAGCLNKERELRKLQITPGEEAVLTRAKSNQGYHESGEGCFFVLLGKGFAETMLELMKKNIIAE